LAFIQSRENYCRYSFKITNLEHPEKLLLKLPALYTMGKSKQHVLGLPSSANEPG
jgi:hypothetical protein